MIAGLAATFATGCKKEEAISASQNDPAKISLSSVASTGDEPEVAAKRIYLKSLLKNVGSVLIAQAEQNLAIRQALYQEVEAKIDGDDNALLEKVRERHPSLGSSAFDMALAPFSNLDGDKYFPQVYIPNYDTLKTQGIIGNTPKITVLFYAGDESISTDSAFQLNANGTWQYTELISESIAEGREVWIFSLNETFTNVIDPMIMAENHPVNLPNPAPLTLDPMAGAKTTADPCNRVYYWPYMDRMRVHNPHESWLAGASDVWMYTYSGWNTPNSTNPFNGTPNQSLWLHNGGGQLQVKKVKRDQLGKMQVPNFGYAGSWAPGSCNARGWQGDVFVYCLYECDGFPTGKRGSSVNVNGTTFSWEFRSADPAWDEGKFLYYSTTQPNMNNYSTFNTNKGLRFSSRL